MNPTGVQSLPQAPPWPYTLKTQFIWQLHHRSQLVSILNENRWEKEMDLEEPWSSVMVQHSTTEVDARVAAADSGTDVERASARAHVLP